MQMVSECTHNGKRREDEKGRWKGIEDGNDRVV